jgi:hypothetical protein
MATGTAQQTVKVTINWENACEDGWSLFSHLMAKAHLPDPQCVIESAYDVPVEIWEQLQYCPHGAPACAPSIFSEIPRRGEGAAKGLGEL